MSKKIVFQKSFLVSGIMCFDSCGNTIQGLLKACIDDCIGKKILPADAKLIVDAEPSGLGIHKITISIGSESGDFILIKNFHSIVSAKIKEDISYEVIDEQEENENKTGGDKNRVNILINLLSQVLVLTLSLVFLPSIVLTVGLSAITFLSTLFTSREYLFAFFQNFRTRNFANMASMISLGWFLSMAHTLFHAISMPLTSSFSMVFMNFLMPTMLITCINGMDEVKRLVIEKAKKIQLKGIKTLFPKMSATYRCYKLNQAESERLSHTIELTLKSSASGLPRAEEAEYWHRLLDTQEVFEENRSLLSVGLVIDVNPEECFPVDCILIKGSTVIDASILTGEPHQSKSLWQFIPAGAINLGQKVSVYVIKNSYNSTVNTLLFRSNRAKESSAHKKEVPKFAYLYTALIIVGLLGAIFIPIALGVVTIPLLMQNIMGILFSVCPCTIAIAHQLPQLISLHHRSIKGIQLRDDGLVAPQSDEIHTIVFDKTGTLTTGDSLVESSDIPATSPLWHRIYLLEKAYGREHPLAKAIQKHYDANLRHQVLIDEIDECAMDRGLSPRVQGRNAHPDEINECVMDHKNRGLSARVQERTIHIGNFAYLKENGIVLPEPDKSKIEQGFSAVCVAEDKIYKGIIYVKHEIRKGVLESLTRLKKEEKRIIMLTGDNFLSAQGFNKQMNFIFEENDIYAGQTPGDKEAVLSTILSTEGVNPKGVWFVGDGLNDAPCCRIVSEKGGVSCAMDSKDKSAFFTDIILNGSLDYLFKHNKLNDLLQQNIAQNKGLLTYSTLAFLAFIISFSTVGIAVSPLIPMAVMLSTTLYVLFNSYRTQVTVDMALDQECPWYKKLLGSDFSIGLLLTASTLLIAATLVATISTGGIALPVIAFTAGVALALSSACTLSAITLLALFSSIFAATLLTRSSKSTLEEDSLSRTPITDGFSKQETTRNETKIENTPGLFLAGVNNPKEPIIKNIVSEKDKESPKL